jgi:hypothetical protein
MSVSETTVYPMDEAVEHTGTVLAACLRVNVMVSLYVRVRGNFFFAIKSVLNKRDW